MKKHSQTLLLGTALIGLSVVLHAIHYAIFRDIHHIMIFLVADIAFIPLEVFFVSVVLERIIEKRDERSITKKLNMLIGLFYQEVGNHILMHLTSADDDLKSDQFDATIDFNWDESKYEQLAKHIMAHKYHVNMSHIDLFKIDEKLTLQKSLIVNLISNPAIHEHGAFSEVLMSLFHLADELKHRPIEALDAFDLDHLKVDIERVYKSLSEEWVSYMSHLQVDYPYLFLTAVKNNPFDMRSGKIKEREALSTYL
ncbi:hypothetical protein [Fusibacter ferrireducens]|uniref:Uncharacterized protein n=1 Tax=Fusibacter ferrireducens TaxID=2785058 RepID=A0ABR9ZUT1_9FIRM|nr:hypothetical protein [Fusibacter ferrireducens]MBF4693918.1 hypothetical protein [Fusibacter ferrireducens]